MAGSAEAATFLPFDFTDQKVYFGGFGRVSVLCDLVPCLKFVWHERAYRLFAIFEVCVVSVDWVVIYRRKFFMVGFKVEPPENVCRGNPKQTFSLMNERFWILDPVQVAHEMLVVATVIVVIRGHAGGWLVNFVASSFSAFSAGTSFLCRSMKAV